MEKTHNHSRSLSWIALGVSFVLIVAEYLLFGCPIRFLTGICCPGCGMTRAVWALCHLDAASAVYYHPLVFLMPAVLIVWLLRKRIPKHVYYALFIAAGAAFLAVYAYRLASGGEVVYAHPQEGLIFRLWELWKTALFN